MDDGCSAVSEVLHHLATEARQLFETRVARIRLDRAGPGATDILAISTSSEQASVERDKEIETVEESLEAPLMDRQGSQLGMIELSVKPSGSFAESDRLRLRRFARVASLAIENAMLFEKASQSAETVGQAIIVATSTGAIMDWNTDAENLFGYTRHDAVGQHLNVLFPPARRTELAALLEQVQRGFSTRQMRASCKKKDGARIEVVLIASWMRVTKSAVPAVIIFAQDLRPQQSVEIKLAQAQRMEVLGQLMAGMVHDFNNLLTVILGFSEILMHRCAAADSSREILGEIHKAGSRAEALTRQLLSFSRKQECEMKVLDVNAVVSETEKLLGRVIGENIAVTTIFAPQLWPVKADAGQLQQVILNLAVNARDAMPQGGRLTIETDNVYLDETYARTHTSVLPGNYVMLAISDTGVGFNHRSKSRSTDMLPAAIRSSPGLATASSIVSLCNGSVELASAPGRGASYRVYLPQAPEMPKPNAALGSGAHNLPRGHETVLLVEDEDCVRSLARQVLEICGYKVLEAVNDEEAMRHFEQNASTLRLLITDVVMPRLDGFSLSERMLDAKPDLRVLFLSGYPAETIMHQDAVDSNVAFLQKPFTTGALAQKVREILDQRI